MEKDVFIIDVFIPAIKEYFKIVDDTQDLKLKILTNKIVEEALNFTNQTTIIKNIENIILDFGINTYEQGLGGAEGLKALSVGKVKMEYMEGGSKSKADLSKFLESLKPFKRMRIL